MAAATEREEVEELDRVLTRLALTEETNLQKACYAVHSRCICNTI